MKRFRLVLVLATSAIIGCGGGGVEIGTPSDTSKGAQTDEFREAMKNAGNKMMAKKAPKKAAAASTKSGE